MMTSTVILGSFGDDVDSKNEYVEHLSNLLVIDTKVHHETKQRAFCLVPDLIETVIISVVLINSGNH